MPKAKGELIKSLRERKGWTQEDLAHKAGRTRRAVQNCEAVTHVHISTISDIAAALGVAPEQLIEGDDSQSQHKEEGRSETYEQIIDSIQARVAAEGLTWVPRDVVEFCATFEVFMGRFKNFEQAEFVPKPVWKILDNVAYSGAWGFIERNGLEKYDKLPSHPDSIKGHQLYELLAFLLKNSFEDGYLLYKFRIYDLLPRPNHRVNIVKIIDSSKIFGDLSGIEKHIEVFLQRSVAFLQSDAVCKRSLFNWIGETNTHIVANLLDDWSAVCRETMLLGLAVSKAEEEAKQKR